MQPTTLYTLKRREVMAGDYVEMMRYAQKPIPVAGSKGLHGIDLRGHPYGVFDLDRQRVYAVEEPGQPVQFIAMEPELERMMRAPFQAEVEQLKARVELEHANWQLATSQGQRLEQRLKNLRTMTWWRRAWCAMRGDF